MLIRLRATAALSATPLAGVRAGATRSEQWPPRTCVLSSGRRAFSSDPIAVREYGCPKLSGSSSKAGLLIIGDEILSGKVVDSNGSWLSKMLHNRGVDVCRIETVGDCMEEIQDSIRRIKNRVGDAPVFTSGGIGPTHDDVTYQAIADTFGMKLKVHEETLKRMTKHYTSKGLEVNEMRLRMATLPENCEVLFSEGMWVPLAVVQGVHILPGIPRLFQSMLEAHADRFEGKEYFDVELFSDEGEGDLAKSLADIAARNPHVKIGSYPKVTTTAGGLDGSDQGWRVRLAIVGRDQESVLAVGEEIKKSIRTVEITTEFPRIIGMKRGGATAGRPIQRIVGVQNSFDNSV